MKKTLLLLLVFVTAAMSAQITGNTTLTVKLNHLTSITVNQPSVIINVDTEAEYMDGAETTLADHLTTFSTSGYTVSARYTTSALATGMIGIKAGQNGLDYPNPIQLTDTNQTVFEGTSKGRKSHDVTYSVHKDANLYDLVTSGLLEPTDLTTVIEYSIVAQ